MKIPSKLGLVIRTNHIQNDFKHAREYSEEELNRLRNIWMDAKEEVMHQKPFIFDDYNKKVLGNLFKYFTLQKNSILDINKGLFLSGGVGYGKTDLIEIFRRMGAKIGNGFRMEKATDLVFHFQRHGNLDKYTNKTVRNFRNGVCMNNDPKTAITFCFDEIGRESRQVQYMGNLVNLFELAVDERYRLWKEDATITHFITNMPENELIDYYGEMCVTRIMEMTNYLKLEGYNRRFGVMEPPITMKPEKKEKEVKL